MASEDHSSNKVLWNMQIDNTLASVLDGASLFSTSFFVSFGIIYFNFLWFFFSNFTLFSYSPLSLFLYPLYCTSSPNLNDPEVVVRRKGLRLTDISPAVGELPPLPYPTDSSGQGTPPPQSCQPPVDVVPYPGVIRFGATGDQSYLGFSLRSAERNYFLSR